MLLSWTHKFKSKFGGIVKFSTKSWERPEGIDTGIKIHSCVARKHVPLILSKNNIATWYTCGPTVYDTSHIGHASCYVKVDIIQRIIRHYFQINLINAMNITDIDDKIIQRGLETNTHWEEIARMYEDEFWDDMRNLGVIEPDIILRVTQNIPTIIEFIKGILKQNKAYITNDGSVYFNIKSYSSYGKLHNVYLEDKEHGTKSAAEDFALWKAKKDNEPYWDSPWGPGRPGWHIECSALASKIFGNKLDFHAGGIDLKFPHHENEETQSCSFHKTQQWVNYWFHTGQLNSKGNNSKMSKSLKNTISIKELLKTYNKHDFRMACLLSNYRNPMVYSEEMMSTARNTLSKFLSFNSDCKAYIQGKKAEKVIRSEKIFSKIDEAKQLIDIALKDDFNTAKCITYLLDLVKVVSKDINANENNEEYVNTSSNTHSIIAAKNFVNKIIDLFGLYDENLVQKSSDTVKIENLVNDFLSIRKMLREHGMLTKNANLFEICDEMRQKLYLHGIELTDHQKGTSWKFIK